MQQRSPVDVRLVRHAELDEPGAAVTFHGPAFLGSAVPDLAAAGRIPSIPHGRTAAASVAQVVQMNDVRCAPGRPRNTVVVVRTQTGFFSVCVVFIFFPQKKCNILNFRFYFNTFVVIFIGLGF